MQGRLPQPDPAEIGAVAKPAEGPQHPRRVPPDQVRRCGVGVAHRVHPERSPDAGFGPAQHPHQRAQVGTGDAVEADLLP